MKRPWIYPEDVRNYTDHKDVADRNDARLAIDIARAEQKVINITHNRFEDYDELPQSVRTAVILVAEAYAKNAVEATKRNIKSESFDDYSYTVERAMIDIDALDLDDLLSDYVLEAGKGNITMRLRKL